MYYVEREGPSAGHQLHAKLIRVSRGSINGRVAWHATTTWLSSTFCLPSICPHLPWKFRQCIHLPG